MRSVERPLRSVALNSVREGAPRRARRSVTHRTPFQRCSWTSRPANEWLPTTRATNRPDLSRVNVKRGRTAIVTGVLRRLRQLAWYVVAILVRARYCHAPFTPVRMVATARGEPSPYGCA